MTGTAGETRTLKGLRPTDFKSVVYTNSTTAAYQNYATVFVFE